MSLSKCEHCGCEFDFDQKFNRLPCPDCQCETRFVSLKTDQYPLPRAKVRRHSEAALKQMSEAGIRWVQYLGCNNPREDCAAVLALAGKKIPIDSAPSLPLPLCTRRYCKCLIIATEP